MKRSCVGCAPILIRDFAFLHGVGPRVAQSRGGLLTGWGCSSPYEDLTLKTK